MRSTSARRFSPTVACAAALGASIAAPVFAHDDDVRKLLDREPPVFGPIITARDLGISGGTQGIQGLFDSSNMTLLANMPLNTLRGPSNVNVTDGNDCWGYTSPSGREYAIMGVRAGHAFVEVSDPTNPQLVNSIPGPASLWHDVKVLGEYAYAVSEGGAGIRIFDLSNIDNGVVTLVRSWTSGGYATTHNIVANEEAGTLWLAGANIGNGGLIHVDISNPTNPQLDGGWTEMYVHDAQVVNWDNGPLAGRELAFCAGGFSGGSSQTGLRIVDVTNPNNTQTLATLFYPSAGYAHQVWLSEDQRYLYLNDELDEGSLVSTTTTRIINVEDPTNPFLVKTFTSGRAAIDHNLYINDSIMYQANYRSGLRVFDIIDPENPVQIAYFDTYPGSDAAAFNGAWSSYPYLDSGTIVLSDIERGLFLVRLDADLDGFAFRESGAPSSVDPSGGTPLAVGTVTRGSVSLTGATLFADTGSGFQSFGAVVNPDGSVSAESPQIACGETLRYYFQATDSDGLTKTFPAGGASQALEAPVASETLTPFDDDFQTNQGWSVSGSVGDGAWERAIPQGGGDRGDPPSDFDGSGFCFVTDNEDGNSDVDGGTTTLTSPALDASGDGIATLRYALWFSNNVGEVDDTMIVEISNNNGATWSTLDTIDPFDPEAGGGWNEYSFVLSDIFTNPSSQVRVRFRAGDTGTPSVVEAAVDAVRVEVLACEDAPSGCSPVDLNQDGSLNFSDVTLFLTLFAESNTDADLNNDGSFNFGDVTAFLTLYAQGCP